MMSIVLLFTLFVEPRVSKAQAKKLKEDSRSCRNTNVYPFLAGIAASLLADTAVRA